MLWVAILSTIHWGVQFRMLTRWWRIQFSARTVRVGSEFIRLAYLVSWSWMEDLCIHLMVKKWHGRLPFLKLYTNFKQFRSKRPLIGSNSNCLNNGSVWALYVLIEIILMNLFWIFMNRWHSNPHAKIPYVKRDWTILQYSVRNIYSGKNLFNLLSTPENFFNLLATISIWFFQDICSFKFNPRKLKFWTLSMLMSLIFSSGRRPPIFLLTAWNTIYFVFFTFHLVMGLLVTINWGHQHIPATRLHTPWYISTRHKFTKCTIKNENE